MTALAANPTSTEAASPSVAAVATRTLAVVRAPDVAGPVPVEVQAAEARWWRGLLIGIAIGVPACALIWMGLVGIAMVMANPDWPVWPALGMAAVVGVFAGAFLGGWAGVTACAEALDDAELHRH